MKTKIILIALLLFNCGYSYSTNQLQIINPQGWWSSYSAKIYEAELQIKPIGSYIENNLYLTIGLASPFVDNSVQLEINLDFDLPMNSMIIDSWLWIEGVPKQAEILDRWTASNIYEEIVDRRKDPSLLVKNGANQYKISIYPLKPNETRKFKITYLTPANWSKNQIVCEYPYGILKYLSENKTKLTVYAYSNLTFGNFEILNSDLNFTEFSNTEYGSGLKTELFYQDLGVASIVCHDSNNSPVKVYKYGTNEEGIYQISIMPSEVIELESSSKKVCYLVDFDKLYVSSSQDKILSYISSAIGNSLSEKDSFNIIFSNLELEVAFETWKSATKSNIEEAIAGVKLSDYSNLIQLLAKGINFVKAEGGSGNIVLLTNNSVFEGIDKTNQIIYDLNTLNSNKTQIDVINYTNDYYNYYWIGNGYFYGNEYLLTNIARTNSGNYFNYYDEVGSKSLAGFISETINSSANSSIKNFDINTDLETGYCYGRINMNSDSYGLNLNKTISQIGKYKGQFPINIEFSGEIESTSFHKEFKISESEITESDSLLETLWIGFDIMQLERESQSSDVINEIIFESVSNRILSNYTAFLCLEDSINIENPEDPENPDIPVNSKDIKSSPNEIKAYPNPFSTNIDIYLTSKGEIQSLEIYNIMGQCIKSFEIISGQKRYSWDGKNNNGSEVPEGIYLVIAKYDDKTVTFKIQKV